LKLGSTQEKYVMLVMTDTPFMEASQNYSPEDLEAIRQAFMRACGENPIVSETEAQRQTLAKAFVSTYRRDLTQSQLIAPPYGRLDNAGTDLEI
jgi:hypothetical protein